MRKCKVFGLKKLLLLFCFILILSTKSHATDIGDIGTGGIIEHDCNNYLSSQYDASYHWKYCTVCGKIFNKVTHSFTQQGSTACTEVEWARNVCACGYSYNLPKTHRSTGWRPSGRNSHFDPCADCGGWITEERCKDASGNYLGCGREGTCAICGGTCNAQHGVVEYYYNQNNLACRQCGTVFSSDITMTSEAYPGGNGYQDLIKASFTLINGAELDIYSVPDETYFGCCDPSVNGAGSATNKHFIKRERNGNHYDIWWTQDWKEIGVQDSIQFEDHFYTYSGNYLTVYGVPVINGIHLGVATRSEWISPTISSVTWTDSVVKNSWSTQRTYTVNGYDDISPSSIVEYYVNGVCVYSGKTSSRTFAYQFSPNLEIGETPVPCTIRVHDVASNYKDYRFSQSKIDSKPPTSSVSDTPFTNEWSRSKTATFSANDGGIGKVQFSFNDPNDSAFVDMVSTGNGNYVLNNYEVTVSDGVLIGSEGRKLAVYYRDGLGNTLTTYVWCYNLDKERPTVSYDGYKYVDGKARVSLSGSDGQGSGMGQYGVSTKNDGTDITWSNAGSIDIASTGTYYFYTKDKVGNVSHPTAAVWVPVAYTVKYNVNNGTGSIGDKSATPGETFNLAGSGFSRTGYILDGWSTSSTGGVVYKLFQSVKDIADPGGSITLYAHWKPITYEVKVYSNKPDSSTGVLNKKK